MARFEIDVADAEATVQRAWDTSTSRFVVLERGIRHERTRKIQALPTNPAIAPYERIRLGNRVHVIHPAPLEFAQPLDEFDVAQAIGSMLDGLAWLHANGMTHGAIDATALTAGPTGGRLSLAGALSQRAHATAEDDVYAASVLAFTVLVGDAPGPDAVSDVRLADAASLPIAEAIRAGLDANPSRRPSAASLATMVRGEYLPPVDAAPLHPTVVGRLRGVLAIGVASMERLVASLAQALRPYATRGTAGIGAAFAMFLLVGGLALADQRGTGASADASSSPVESTAPDVPAARVARALPSPRAPALATVALEDVIAKHDATAQQHSPLVAVLSSAATVAASIPAPTTTAAPAPPQPVVVAVAPTTTAAPTTTLAPPPVVTPTTTIAPTTTRATTTTRVTTTTIAPTTTRATTTTATTTTRSGKGKDR